MAILYQRRSARAPNNESRAPHEDPAAEQQLKDNAASLHQPNSAHRRNAGPAHAAAPTACRQAEYQQRVRRGHTGGAR